MSLYNILTILVLLFAVIATDIIIYYIHISITEVNHMSWILASHMFVSIICENYLICNYGYIFVDHFLLTIITVQFIAWATIYYIYERPTDDVNILVSWIFVSTTCFHFRAFWYTNIPEILSICIN